ncbi:MAG: hypothetical protein R3C56_02630 [Pirellulaceae bacterium]
MKRPLTNQQQAVYNLIRERIIHRGYGPTKVGEIGEHMNIKSPNGVMCHLRALVGKDDPARIEQESHYRVNRVACHSLVGATLKIQGSITDSVCTRFGENCQHVDLADLTEQGSSFFACQ